MQDGGQEGGGRKRKEKGSKVKTGRLPVSPVSVTVRETRQCLFVF